MGWTGVPNAGEDDMAAMGSSGGRSEAILFLRESGMHKHYLNIKSGRVKVAGNATWLKRPLYSDSGSCPAQGDQGVGCLRQMEYHRVM